MSGIFDTAIFDPAIFDTGAIAVAGAGGGIPFFRRLTKAEEEILDTAGLDLVGQVVANIQAREQQVTRKRVKAAFRALAAPVIPSSAVLGLAVELGRQMAAENEEEEAVALLLAA